MPKSTLLNILQTLESRGYVYKSNNSQNYRLGFKLMELGYNVRSALPIVQIALPIMEELQSMTGEIVYLTTHINGRVFYLECVYPSKRLISYSVCGKTVPMHCTGCGKAMLMFMPEKRIDGIIAQWGLTQYTTNTITDQRELKKTLARYREKGYALDNEEESYNVKCIAMPIRLSGNIAGALSISGSTMSMTEDKFPHYARLLVNACNLLAQYIHLFPAIQLIKK
jgi:DNA-binding IclR family transcriptional regulator